MEEFEKRVKNRMIWLSVIAVLLLTSSILKVVTVTDAEKTGASGFAVGFSIAAGLLFVIRMIYYWKALGDPVALRKLYNQENDERMKVIRAKAGQPLLSITSSLMLIAGAFLGNVDEKVMFALLIAAVVQLLISIAVKFYFIRTM